jgi:citrate lyase subunit alpha/citrate CoA-transferase
VQGSGLPVVTINQFKEEAERICGKPEKPKFLNEIVAAIKWVDGTVIDSVWKLSE